MGKLVAIQNTLPMNDVAGWWDRFGSRRVSLTTTCRRPRRSLSG